MYQVISAGVPAVAQLEARLQHDYTVTSSQVRGADNLYLVLKEHGVGYRNPVW
jgi:hypothetical protein